MKCFWRFFSYNTTMVSFNRVPQLGGVSRTCSMIL